MSYQLLSETTPRAHLQHCCDGCGEGIKPGTRYCRRFGLADGKAETQALHLGDCSRDDEAGYCMACNGSGEGQFDGTTCGTCCGKGEA